MKPPLEPVRGTDEPTIGPSSRNSGRVSALDRHQGRGDFFKRISVFAAAGAILIALCGLLGYVPGLQFLGRIHEGFIPMAPSTAVAFILLGGAQFSLTRRAWPGPVLVLFGALAALVSLFGALEVAGHFSGTDLNFEDVLVPSAGYLGAIPMARMSPSTGAAFFIAGLATLVLVVRSAVQSPRPHLEHWASCLGGLVLATSIVFCVAYLYGTPLLYGRGATVPMALTTAFGFLMLGAAAVGASGRNAVLVRLAVGSSTSSYLLRVFLPLTTLSTLLGGFAVLRVDAFSGVNPMLVAAATAVLMASITGLITLCAARNVASAIDRAEEEMHRYEHIVSSTTDMLALLDKNFVYVAANAAYLQAFGRPREELIGRSAADVFGKEFFRTVIKPRAERCLAGEVIRYQDWFEFPIASRKYMEVAYSPYLGPDREIRGFVVSARDVTERMRAEVDLRESEGRAKAVLETAVDGIITIDERGIIESFNLAAERMFGYTADEVIGQTVNTLMPSPYQKEHNAYIQNYLETGHRKIIGIRREVTGQRKNGATFPIDLSVSEITTANRHLFTGVARDITERKRVEDELKQRTHDLGERLKELNCLYVISKLAEQPGITAEQILQGTIDVMPSSWQYPEVTKARITLEGRVYSTADFRESQWRQACEIVVRGEPIGSIEVYYLTEQPASDEGPFLKEERSLIDAIAERLGRTIERVRLEEERATLKEQLHQAQKMEAVAQLAGGVAHDFNNLLMVINGYVSLAKNALPADHDAVESLSGVQEAADQAAGVTRSLLTFSHKMEAKKEPVELQASVEASLRLLRHVLPASIEVVANAPDEPVWVRADETQLHQIIMNLAINARDAMPGGGTLKITVSKSTPQTNGPATLGDPQRLVAWLVVSDSGTGMEPEVRERIFEPFFTTKPRGQGTGLGLAIIHSIVEDHNGRIGVESEPGQGATFTVELPLLDVDALRGVPQEAIPPRRGRGEVVLLAEDNRHIRGILTSALGSLGYEVVQANDGSALMDCFERHRGRIGLLVIDVDLPKRSGIDCLREIRSSGGFAPAIVMTGSAGAGLAKRLDEDTTLLRKPFQIADLTALAGNVLAARRRREAQT